MAVADDSAKTELARRIAHVLAAKIPAAGEVRELRRLSGGASQETWSFVLDRVHGPLPLILRRAPGGRSASLTGASVPLAIEAKLLQLARAAGVAVPEVRYVLDETDGVGAGFIMDFIAGETIPRKILRDEAFAAARSNLAAECGMMLARIHAIDPKQIPELQPQSARDQVEQYRTIYDALDDPRPVFEIAFRWLDENAPTPAAPCIVHGDFRNGNLIVGTDGLRAVLDWELAHVGDACADLGWICVNSWRFGVTDKPVGGFGTREQLFRAYESAGGPAVDPQRVHYWEVFGTLKWGVICMMMYGAYRSGVDRSVERAAIGRRTSETEIDLLNLIAARQEA